MVDRRVITHDVMAQALEGARICSKEYWAIHGYIDMVTDAQARIDRLVAIGDATEVDNDIYECDILGAIDWLDANQ